MGVTLAMSAAYHPQTDGVTERLNAEITGYLRRFVSDRLDWDEQLWIAEFAYNNTVSSATEMTPFMVTKGYSPLSPNEYFINETVKKIRKSK
jgi:hypothetical protein